MSSRGRKFGFLLFLIGLFCVSFLAMPAGADAQARSRQSYLSGVGLAAAPVNPAFEKYMAKSLASGAASATRKTTRSGHALGFVPSPMKIPAPTGKSASAYKAATLPAKFDLRTSKPVGVTAIRDQAQCGSCWAFGGIASLESNLLYKSKKKTDFSEADINENHGFDYGVCMGGDAFMVAAYVARWGGPVTEADVPYPYWFTEVESESTEDSAGTGASSASTPGVTTAYTIQNIYFLPQSSHPLSDSDIVTVKEALYANGAVAIDFFYDTPYYNSTNHAFYCSDSDVESNHMVAIVGWDDTYSRSNFNTQPPGDGAFIMKNSWGTGWGESGYFYMSYYDSSLCLDIQFYDVKSSRKYTRIYQYDPLGWVESYGWTSGDTTMAWFSNVFMASAHASTIKAVSVYTPVVDSTYELYVYSDVTPSSGPRSGTLAGSTTGTITIPGYITIPVTHASVTANKPFSVVMKLTTPGYNYPIPVESVYEGYSTAAGSCPGQTYVSHDGATWIDAAGAYNVNLKAFATK